MTSCCALDKFIFSVWGNWLVSALTILRDYDEVREKMLRVCMLHMSNGE